MIVPGKATVIRNEPPIGFLVTEFVHSTCECTESVLVDDERRRISVDEDRSVALNTEIGLVEVARYFHHMTGRDGDGEIRIAPHYYEPDTVDPRVDVGDRGSVVGRIGIVGERRRGSDSEYKGHRCHHRSQENRMSQKASPARY